MGDNRDPFLLPRMFSKRFIIFGIVVIAAALIGVIFFDKTDPKKFDPFHVPHRDTTGPVPYRAIESDTATLNEN